MLQGSRNLSDFHSLDERQEENISRHEEHRGVATRQEMGSKKTSQEEEKNRYLHSQAFYLLLCYMQSRSEIQKSEDGVITSHPRALCGAIKWSPSFSSFQLIRHS